VSAFFAVLSHHHLDTLPAKQQAQQAQYITVVRRHKEGKKRKQKDTRTEETKK
jgi:hypothetical protein